MTTSEQRPICYTIRKGGNRVTYRPDYCTTLPWIAYTNGTAGRHFATEERALYWLNSSK